MISSEQIRLGKALEELAVRLKAVPEALLARVSERLQLNEAKLRSCSPSSRIERQHQYLDDLHLRMTRTMEGFFEKNSYVLESLGQRLEGSSLNSTLRKGFAYLRDEGGKVIDRARDLKAGSLVSVTLRDGDKKVIVED